MFSLIFPNSELPCSCLSTLWFANHQYDRSLFVSEVNSRLRHWRNNPTQNLSATLRMLASWLQIESDSEASPSSFKLAFFVSSSISLWRVLPSSVWCYGFKSRKLGSIPVSIPIPISFSDAANLQFAPRSLVQSRSATTILIGSSNSDCASYCQCHTRNVHRR